MYHHTDLTVSLRQAGETRIGGLVGCGVGQEAAVSWWMCAKPEPWLGYPAATLSVSSDAGRLRECERDRWRLLTREGVGAKTPLLWAAASLMARALFSRFSTAACRQKRDPASAHVRLHTLLRIRRSHVLSQWISRKAVKVAATLLPVSYCIQAI